LQRRTKDPALFYFDPLRLKSVYFTSQGNLKFSVAFILISQIRFTGSRVGLANAYQNPKNKMKKTAILFGAALLAASVSMPLTAQNTSASGNISQVGTVMVGGEAMYPQKNIVENAVNSKDHTTLVAAVKAAGLVETLSGKGPFTVFAPTNDAFENLPEGTVWTLLKPENKAKLTTVFTYHVVAGKMDYAALTKAIKAGKGKATLKTVSGGSLTAMMNGPQNIAISDESGNVANVTISDVSQSNGVIHVVDRVVLPQ
jgi:uncharacterized surface protein with fasciclin (FAS1) repeats